MDKRIEAIRQKFPGFIVGSVGQYADWLEEELASAQERIEELEKIRYLPTVCHMCGRLRVFYDPKTYQVECEKCGADASVMNAIHKERSDG